MDLQKLILQYLASVGGRLNNQVVTPVMRALVNKDYAIVSPSATPTAMPSSTPTMTPSPTPTPSVNIGQAYQSGGIVPSVSNIPLQSPSATPTPAPSPLASILQKGFQHWGNPPAATLSGVMADEIQKYPELKTVAQKHPELLAVISLLETGGGRHMPPEYNPEFPGAVTNENRQYNMWNWGTNPAYGFNPSSFRDVISKVAQGIATKPQFADFRKSGDIADLAKVYSPSSKTNPQGGDTYVNNYNSIASWFK